MKRNLLIGLLLGGVLSISFNAARAQYLYFSPSAFECSCDGIDCWRFIYTYRIILRAPNVTDAVGASFRIESELYGPEDFVSIELADGVVVESGDLFSGIRLSFPAGQYEADTLMTIHIELNPPDSYGMGVCTRDVDLYRLTGDALSLDDVWFYISHCHDVGAWIEWTHPDTVSVPIGGTSTVDVYGLGNSLGGLTGTNLTVEDDMGWFAGCTGCSISADCGPCPWHAKLIRISVAVPKEAPKDTVGRLRIVPTGPCCLTSSTTLYVRAIPGVPVDPTSWGRIKSMYGRE
jgi:hypothetical protein